MNSCTKQGRWNTWGLFVIKRKLHNDHTHSKILYAYTNGTNEDLPRFAIISHGTHPTHGKTGIACSEVYGHCPFQGED
jgi:hypothetical protein